MDSKRLVKLGKVTTKKIKGNNNNKNRDGSGSWKRLWTMKFSA